MAKNSLLSILKKKKGDEKMPDLVETIKETSGDEEKKIESEPEGKEEKEMIDEEKESDSEGGKKRKFIKKFLKDLISGMMMTSGVGVGKMVAKGTSGLAKSIKKAKKEDKDGDE